MFLKLICKVFFIKNIVKTARNGGINGRSSIPALFPGQSTPFRQNRQPFPEKPGGTANTNTAGKKHSLQGWNKADLNSRPAAGAPQIKKKRPDKIGTLLLGYRAVLFAPHTPQIKKETPPTCLGEFPFYAGGGGRTHTCY